MVNRRHMERSQKWLLQKDSKPGSPNPVRNTFVTPLFFRSGDGGTSFRFFECPPACKRNSALPRADPLRPSHGHASQTLLDLFGLRGRGIRPSLFPRRTARRGHEADERMSMHPKERFSPVGKAGTGPSIGPRFGNGCRVLLPARNPPAVYNHGNNLPLNESNHRDSRLMIRA